MKLYSSPTSPYARKVRVVILEKGLEAQIALEPAAPMGTAEQAAAVRGANPLGKIPALVLDDGATLYDSPVICEYLDAVGTGATLLPASGPTRWTALRRQALGDGVADAAFNLVMEARRPPEQRSEEWLNRWTTAILTAADVMDAELAAADAPFDLGAIALACAFGYVAFRLPGIDWTSGRPALSAWATDILARPSLSATAPPV